MSWIIVSIGAYVLNAFAALVDKFLLKKSIPEPAVYAFYVSAFGILGFVFYPFDPSFPPLNIILVSLAAGLTFTAALFLFYTALKSGEASGVVPLVGGLTPLFILLLAGLILSEHLNAYGAMAFVLIVIGGFLISRETESVNFPKEKLLWISVFSAFFFGISHTLSKYVYIHHSFAGGLFWKGMGNLLGALIIILFPVYRRAILSKESRPKMKAGAIFLFGQAAAAISFILINYAFSIGPVSVVNAMAGIQYAAIFAIAISLSGKYPQLLSERITKEVIAKKLVSIILISTGIYLLFLSNA